MIVTYASFRSQPPANIFDITSVAGTAPSVARNFYVQFKNRAGRNLLSAPKSITSTGVRLTINDNILADEEVFWVVISYETTGNDTDAGIVAQWQAREATQLAKRTLPATIDFTLPDHFIFNRSVATSTDLPTTDILPGAIALVADSGVYYRYDPESGPDADGNLLSYGAFALGIGNWIEYDGNFNAYIDSTSGIGGSDRALFTVENSLKIPPKIGNTDSIAERYWFNNGLTADGGSPVEKAQFTLEISVNDVPSYENIFADKFQYYLRGYLDRDTLVLDSSPPTVGVPKTWNPTDGLIELPQQLPRNHSAVYEFVLSCNNDDLLGLVPNQPEIELNITEVLNIRAKVSELGKVLGNLVFGDYDKLLIVPGLKRLSGKASIAAGFLIEDKDEQLVTGLVADTANQQAAMSGALNGLITIRQPGDALQFAEVLRATVSTESGNSRWLRSASTSLTNEAVKVTITHPVTATGAGKIRIDYPDSAIAGNEKANFAPQGIIYLDVDGIVYQSSIQPLTPTTTQEITFTDLAAFINLGPVTVPNNLDPEFSLFVPDDVVATSAGAGSITGNVRAYVVYSYPTPNTQATKINHNATNAIPTLTTTLADSIGNALLKTQNLSDVPDKVAARTNLNVPSTTDFNAHVSDTGNPHAVTTASIGAAPSGALSTTNSNVNNNTNAITLNTNSRLALGTAANKNVGTAIGDLIEIVDVTGNAALPTLNGSQLTGIARRLTIEFVSGTFPATVSVEAPINYLIDTSTAVATGTLPASPPDKGIVAFGDRSKTFGINNATITPDAAHTIDGQPNYVLAIDNKAVTLVFDLANNNYVVN